MYRMKKTPQAGKAADAAAKVARKAAGEALARDTRQVDRRRIQVRLSSIHGKGVFALRHIPAGERIFEYKGQVITWPEALRRHPHDPTQPDHTFYFSLGTKHVIDGNVGGNSSRYINHACDSNCQADEIEGRVFISALRDLHPGEELFYDYGLVIDERHTPKVKKQYECRCGSPNCRRTMLAPRR